MRVAYVCADRGVPVFGDKGASVHVRELTRALSDLGHDVLVVAARLGGARPPAYPVDVVELPLDDVAEETLSLVAADQQGGGTLAPDVRAIVHGAVLRTRALLALRAFAPDVVYERHALFSGAGRVLARELDAPLVLEVNAPLAAEQERYRGLALADTARELELRTLREADLVVAVSSALERWLVESGVAPGRIHLVPNGVDPDRFHTTGAERERIRGELGLADAAVVGFLGTLRPWHDLAALVEGLGKLRRRIPELRLLVVGDGPGRAELEELGATAVVTGLVPHEVVPAYLAAMDVAVAPYGADATYFSPLKLVEYLAAGLPVVAADVGDVRHCIRAGVGGALYEPGDRDGLARELERLVRDGAAAARLGAAGREHVRRHHTWTENARSIVRAAASAGALAA